jgi:hypothetical protein
MGMLVAGCGPGPAGPAAPVVTVGPAPSSAPEIEPVPPPPPAPVDAVARCRGAPDPTDPLLAPRPLTEAERLQLEQTSPGRGCPGGDEIECRYVAARIVVEARQWREAASRMREIAREYPDHPVAVYAVRLALYAQRVLGPSCRDLMVEDARRYVELYCNDARRSVQLELCQELEELAGGPT